MNVVLLKEPSPGCKYTCALGDAGFKVQAVPVIGFERVEKGCQELEFILNQLGSWTDEGTNKACWGVVLTSPRAADAVIKAAAKADPVELNTVQWFVVGEETGARLKEYGIDAQGASAGSAAALLPFIKQSFQAQPGNAQKCLLFVAGNIRRDTIPAALQKWGSSYHEICVYKTTHLENIAIPTIREVVPTAYVFFSPSGVQSVEKAASLQFPDNALFVAIGKTTAQALSSSVRFTTRPILVCAKPTPNAVLDILSNHLTSDT